MSIELITGTPGAGKTTYAVAEVVARELGRKIKLSDEVCIALCLDLGTVVDRRIVAAGVRGLKVEHERLPHILTRDRVLPSDVAKWNEMVSETVDGKRVETDEPVHQRLPTDPPRDVPALVQNWWLWCKPGDLIVVDEVQFVAPRGTLGRKPPYWIEALAIHRHYGVDFLFITQDVQGIDTFIRGKVNPHRHVRSVMGSPVCMVYTWDHCSNTERTSLANKKAWWRRAKHYRLFDSSVAHVGPPTAGRSLLLVIPALLAAFGFGMNHFFNRFNPPSAEASLAPAESAAPSAASFPPPASAPTDSAPPRLAGCIDGPRGGYCIGVDGSRVDMPPDLVAFNARNLGGFIKHDVQSRSSSPSPSPFPAASAALPPPVDAGHITGPEPRNPVRPLAGSIGHYGGGVPAAPAPDLDGAILSGMR